MIFDIIFATLYTLFRTILIHIIKWRENPALLLIPEDTFKTHLNHLGGWTVMWHTKTKLFTFNRWGAVPVLDVEAWEVLLQVFLDQIVRGLFGLTEPSDDERKSVSQRLRLLSCFLKHHPFTDMTITTKHFQSHREKREKETVDTMKRCVCNALSQNMLVVHK